MNSRSVSGLLALCSLLCCQVAAAQWPPGLVSYERPLFPSELKSTTSDGYCTVAFIVHSDGHVEDVVALEASDPAFAEATLVALPRWRFQSSGANVQPRREVLRIEFRQTDAIGTMTHVDAAKAAFPQTPSQQSLIRTISWAQLSAPPERIATQAPVPKAKQSGRAAVSFVIDTDGNVRVPEVVEATAPELGLAALAAVKQWRFTPPTLEGRPVLVQDTRLFTFAK